MYTARGRTSVSWTINRTGRPDGAFSSGDCVGFGDPACVPLPSEADALVGGGVSNSPGGAAPSSLFGDNGDDCGAGDGFLRNQI
ncbi:hypothetical protein Nepgr_025671 [Nepenthes gracilis]|uniref:Uncharacterized protein n=1 Tax=Nepenthes gracilis TaxID=150966 RepID=A0AAD3T6S1_NEPGR|nr:hypothetical protein Nepgr_025671 [Nepenthes gracilis]